MPPATMNIGKSAGRSPASSSRNIAFMTIAAVIGGAYALFRSQSPSQGVVKEDDVASTTETPKYGRSKILGEGDTGAAVGSPPQGHGHTGRSPRKGLE
ncbi:hypothetical protein BDW68DRAFT_175334 [Aspergillus falconensis]